MVARASVGAVLDHVAIAVRDFERAEFRWRTELGGWRLAEYAADAFRARQYLYRNGAKLELLAPPVGAAPENFVRTFLDRHGTEIHHLTLKVPDFDRAATTVTSAGYDVVARGSVGSRWREGFLRPSQVGGIVVQLAWSALTEAEWRAQNALPDPAPPEPVAALTGVILGHRDPDEVVGLWKLLGALVRRTDSGLVCRWPQSVLEVQIRAGARSGPLALVFEGAAARPAEPGIGPRVLPAEATGTDPTSHVRR